MRKSFFLLLLLFVFFCCSPKETVSTERNEIVSTERNEIVSTKENIKETTVISSDEAKLILKDRGLSVLKAIKDKNMELLSNFVHPVKGVRISLFISKDKNDLLFNRNEIKNFFNDNESYFWGYNIFTSEPINENKTTMFFQLIFQDYTKAVKITYNDPTDKHGYLETYEQDYPGSILLECFYQEEDSKYPDFTWRAKRITFEKYEGEWYVVAFNKAFWTP